jgi:hypothetical protein
MCQNIIKTWLNIIMTCYIIMCQWKIKWNCTYICMYIYNLYIISYTHKVCMFIHVLFLSLDKYDLIKCACSYNTTIYKYKMHMSLIKIQEVWWYSMLEHMSSTWRDLDFIPIVTQKKSIKKLCFQRSPNG